MQNGSPGAWDQNASAFLGQAHGMLPADGASGPGYMFYATPDQKANPNMYAGYAGVTNASGAQDIANSVNREQAYRDAYTQMTWGAAVGAAGLGLLGPVATLPGAPILSSAGALGSTTWAAPVGTGAISAGINAGSQYYQNGQINPTDVAASFATGYAGAYGGLLWNVGVNTAGGAATTALNNFLQGKNDSVMGTAIISGVLSSLGYGVGKFGESGINNALKPTINTQNWASTGIWSNSGWNILNQNNLPVIFGSGVGGLGQEVFNKACDSVKSKNQGEK